jgi:hypothetical protein
VDACGVLDGFRRRVQHVEPLLPDFVHADSEPVLASPGIGESADRNTYFAALQSALAAASPASQPGARPPARGWITETSAPLARAATT